MKKIIILLSLLILSSCNSQTSPDFLEGEVQFEKDETGYKFTTASITDSKNKYYNFADFETSELKKIKTFLEIQTSSNIYCMQDKNNWNLCFNNNEYYSDSYTRVSLFIESGFFNINIDDDEPGSKMYLINGNKVDLPKKVKINFARKSAKEVFLDIVRENKDNTFLKEKKVIYQKVDFDIYRSIINNRNSG